MSASPEYSGSSGEATPESDICIAALIAQCRDVAEEDEKYRQQQRVETGDSKRWKDEFGTSWVVGFKAEHRYDETGYLGQQFSLAISVGRSMPTIPQDLCRVARERECAVPDAEHVVDVEVNYEARYRISTAGALGWRVLRTYDLWHDQDDIGLSFDEAGEALSPEDISELIDEFGERERDPEVEVCLAKSLHLEENLAYQSAHDDAGTVVDIFAGLAAEIYLRQAQAALEMYTFRDEGPFDLGTAFPHEMVEELAAMGVTGPHQKES